MSVADDSEGRAALNFQVRPYFFALFGGLWFRDCICLDYLVAFLFLEWLRLCFFLRSFFLFIDFLLLLLLFLINLI